MKVKITQTSSNSASHVLIVEIKTPATNLLRKSAYRKPDVFAVSRDVCGR